LLKNNSMHHYISCSLLHSSLAPVKCIPVEIPAECRQLHQAPLQRRQYAAPALRWSGWTSAGQHQSMWGTGTARKCHCT
jgi:hypothetical protein